MTRESFDSGVIKVTADGEEVFSTYLEDGETLAPSREERTAAKQGNSADITATVDESASTENAGEPFVVGEDATETVVDTSPKAADNKDSWYAYAQSKGFTGQRDDHTIAEYIEKYGH